MDSENCSPILNKQIKEYYGVIRSAEKTKPTHIAACQQFDKSYIPSYHHITVQTYERYQTQFRGQIDELEKVR